MSQGALILPGSPLTGANLANGINIAVGALASQSSGSSAPTLGPGVASALVEGQAWLDTSTTPHTLRVYDGASWVATGTLDTSAHAFQPGSSGTWTPVLAGTGTAGAPTYTTQTGTFEQIGRLIVARFNIVISAKGAPAGNYKITGLPFAAAAGSENGQMTCTYMLGVTLDASYTQLAGLITPASSAIQLYELGSGVAGQVLPVADLAAAAQITGHAIYHT